MVQVPISEKIDFEVNLTDMLRSIVDNTNESVRTFLENLVDQRMQDKIPIMWSSAKESELVRLRAPMDPIKRKLKSQQKKIVSRKDNLVLLQCFMKKFPSDTVLKCTVTIDFAVLITGPEKPAAKRTSLRTYLARQVFQKLHPQLTTEVEYFFRLRLNKSIFDSSPPCNLPCCSNPILRPFISYQCP